MSNNFQIRVTGILIHQGKILIVKQKLSDKRLWSLPGGRLEHDDIDVSAYWYDRDKIILYMQSLGWNVFEMCGGGIAHHITDVKFQIKAKRNIFCFKDGFSLVKLSPHGETDMYYLDFDHSGQTKLDFIEFLFNNRFQALSWVVRLPASKRIENH